MRPTVIVLALLASALLTAAPAMADSRILDEANALYPETRRDLLAQAEAIEQRTGVAVTVLVLTDLDGLSAQEVAAARQTDSEGPGLLLLMAMIDRQVRIQGVSLSDRFADAGWSSLIEDVMLPPLRQGLHATALREGLGAIEAELAGVPRIRAEGGSATREWGALRDVALIMLAGAGVFLGWRWPAVRAVRSRAAWRPAE